MYWFTRRWRSGLALIGLGTSALISWPLPVRAQQWSAVQFQPPVPGREARPALVVQRYSAARFTQPVGMEVCMPAFRRSVLFCMPQVTGAVESVNAIRPSAILRTPLAIGEAPVRTRPVTLLAPTGVAPEALAIAIPEVPFPPAPAEPLATLGFVEHATGTEECEPGRVVLPPLIVPAAGEQ